MLHLLRRRLQKLWSRAPWATLSAIIGVLYVAGFGLMQWAEPATNPIRSLPTYTYFFVVTVTTVGYGDVVPVTAAGGLTASVIAVGSIGAAAVALGKIFTSLGEYIRRREKGWLR